MSSLLMSNKFDSNLCQSAVKNSTQLNQNESKVFVERVISILSENKLKSWLDFGLKAEYERRFKQSLPKDWIQVLNDCGKDVIEVEVQSYSNGTKTFIQLPIRKAKERSTPTITRPVGNIRAPVQTSIGLKEVPKVGSKQFTLKSEDKLVNKPLNIGQKSSGLSSNGLNFMEASGVAEDVISGGKPIPSPVLPEINPKPQTDSDFFDLIVLLAANPSNFVVVPFHSLSNDSEFVNLKHRMNEMYDNEEHRIDLPPEVISAGIFIAGQVDNCWHRMQVQTIVSKDPFLVIAYLSDYGQHKTVDLKHIQPLYNVFRDLPAQAIKASLATVEPVGKDWDVMTSIEFRKMVENKPFVSTVYAINQSDDQSVLSLSLCDTSGADDHYIGSALVEKGFAKPRVPVT